MAGRETGNKPARRWGLWALCALIIALVVVAVFAVGVTQTGTGPAAEQVAPPR